MDRIQARRVTRRHLLAGGLAVSGLAGLAEVSPAAADQPVTDGELIANALEIEQLSLYAYEHALALPDALGETRSLLLVLLGHEKSHAAVLQAELHALGQAPPPALDTVSRANALLSKRGLSTDVGSVRKIKDAIKLLLDVEGLSQGAYWAAAGLLSSSSAVLSAVQALGCEAQHQALLTNLLYPGKIERTVPGAFVEGWQ